MLHIDGLTVSLPGSGEVLHGIDLAVAAGECLAVVGESGAGKSVLARTLLGLTQDDPGTRVAVRRFELGGKDVRRLSKRGWRAVRGVEVSLVLQDALQSLDPLRTTEAEVGETLAIRGVRRAARRLRVISALDDAGLPRAADHLKVRSEELSGGMRQRALIASALVGGARLVVADEPTTALDATVAARILALLARLRDEGRALVLISHDLAAVAAIADRIAVIDHGRIVETGPAAEVLSAPRHDVTRALVAAAPRGAKPFSAAPGDDLVTATGLVRRYRSAQGSRIDAVDDVALRVRAGETVGIVGESGSGKSTLARLLVGAESPDAGVISRTARCIRLIPQDPAASFDPRWSVRRILRTAAVKGTATPESLLERVGLDASLLGRRPATLSGGQRQRVAIARALAADPDLLVCDEPVSALDVTTQAGILELLMTLQRQTGLGLVFISHDLAVIRKISDRVAVMRAGRIVETGPTEEVFARPREAFTRELVQAARTF
ncbi:ABC transporter ATP-binding protein [Microbacterium sp. cx-55]|uniref:ATP-binding cassette domain-containing protein n=1 Tax=Microbacterium sp. cx-55 TaxID=2875948 RepID=UPI001CBFF466|nr:ABC transporter ATP-binding protein [Microbacterium sp. cx-55]MBZ4486119.1 ABC transporter ATP-binding protein [Microbacterium sp. cx-55]UGB34010.1 ABC transporter ATP-binding protein [Microbacterium sp. cx-55]